MLTGRVVEELRGAYLVQTDSGEWLTKISGRFRHAAKQRQDFPAVGDWVSIDVRPAEKKATLQAVLPRKSKLSRKMSGQDADEQLIAANIDTVFIVTSLNKDFNLRRLERYLAMVAESGASAVVLLSKADLVADPADTLREAQVVARGVPVYAISGVTGFGLSALDPYLVTGQTVAVIGSSGVGKSTLINRLTGSEQQKVQAIRDSDDSGRHTTTSRRMIQLPQGGSLIDTPGMRELQLWEIPADADTFADILALIAACQFGNCKHRSDTGCAVQKAIAEGTLSADRYANYQLIGQEAEALAAQRERDALAAANEKIRLAKAAYLKERRQPDPS